MAETSQDASRSAKDERRKHERMLQWRKVYSNWDRDAGHKLVWEADAWLEAFNDASRHRDGDSLRSLRYVQWRERQLNCRPFFPCPFSLFFSLGIATSQ